MLEIFRNMFRRKLRTMLTIFGIAIGIFALTVMGAMAEKMNAMIAGGFKYFTGQITVTGQGGFGPMGSATIPLSSIKKIERIKGVESVTPSVNMLLEEQGMVSLGMPFVIEGTDLSKKWLHRNYRTGSLSLKSGRYLEKNDRGKIVVGADVATNKKLKLGEVFKIKGGRFKVIGILDRTLTGPDKTVVMPIEDARTLYINSQPFLRDLRKQARKAKNLSPQALSRLSPEARKEIQAAVAFKEENITTGANVFWKDGADPEKISKEIEAKVADTRALSPAKMKKELNQASVIFNLITMGSALIALIVGGLSVINTMIMSVSERTREIGIKKAVGARTRNILSEYLLEAAVIGFTGGLLGLAGGVLLTSAANAQTVTKGVEIFLISPRLVGGAMLFAVVLGVIAGIYPAVHAARLNPVRALRME